MYHHLASPPRAAADVGPVSHHSAHAHSAPVRSRPPRLPPSAPLDACHDVACGEPRWGSRIEVCGTTYHARLRRALSSLPRGLSQVGPYASARASSSIAKTGCVLHVTTSARQLTPPPSSRSQHHAPSARAMAPPSRPPRKAPSPASKTSKKGAQAQAQGLLSANNNALLSQHAGGGVVMLQQRFLPGGAGARTTPPCSVGSSGSVGGGGGDDSGEEWDETGSGAGSNKKDARREYHKKIERKRRDRMRSLYDELRSLVRTPPPLRARSPPWGFSRLRMRPAGKTVPLGGWATS